MKRLVWLVFSSDLSGGLRGPYPYFKLSKNDQILAFAVRETW
jgi:hypothetical protein